MTTKISKKLLKESKVLTTASGERLSRGRPRKDTQVTYVAKDPADTVLLLRTLCVTSFFDYIKTVAPYAVMGMVHKEFCEYLQRNPEKAPYILGLLPRGHRKSFIVAMYVCWRIVCNPAITVLYYSSTTDLAEKQLRTIKQTLETPLHQKIFPGLINPVEASRERWSSSEICVDDPQRAKEGVRDSTVATAGLTTTTTGAHADLIVLDDIVEPNNNNAAGRRLVEERFSQMQSILNPGGMMVAVGTRYDPKDLYDHLINTYEEQYDKEGNLIGKKKSWAVFQRVVETDGEFLWPRAKRADGKAFGYNMQELARIKASYLDKSQFYAQYYNDPNRAGSSAFNRDQFVYYEKEKLTNDRGSWKISGKKLNVFAAIDFAYSLSAEADSTAIAVVGMTADKLIYVLDIDRFKTAQIQDYYDHMINLYEKYRFRKMRGEATAAQSVIVKYLKDKLADAGVNLKIEEYKPTKDKDERVNATLRPQYEDNRIFHYKGGNCEILEQELLSAHPEHDDVKNAVADAVDISTPPMEFFTRTFENIQRRRYGRFGGTI